MITYASVCDGIGAAHVAWQPLGYRCVWTSEIEPFPVAVVEHHWHLPNLGDMTLIEQRQLDEHDPIDLLVGGTPCQSFSVAGLRKGLADPRGNLALRFLQLAGATRARWLVWENVPGVLSSGGGRDFGTFLGSLVELGYGFAYRVLDAQYFGVPQRRRRVFVVGHLGDWRRAAAVLFERSCLSGNPPPSREAGKEITHSTSPCIGAIGRGFERAGETRGQDPVVAVAGTLGSNHGNIKAEHAWTGQLCYGGGNTHGPIAAAAVNAGGCKRLDFDSETLVAHSLRADGLHEQEINHDDTIRRSTSAGTGREVFEGSSPRQVQAGSDECQGGSSSQTEALGQPTHCGARERPVAFQTRYARNGRGAPEEVCPTLSGADAGATSDMRPCVAANGVRRLTPAECEALQGFPRGYTAIEYRGKPAADGPRYRALGNSMAVPVMRWIGRRILEAEEKRNESASD